MPNTIQTPLVQKFVANGLSDAQYMNPGDPNAQVGGCVTLQNLVPDRHTRGLYAPRPAYNTGFDASNAPGTAGGTGITADGQVVCALVLGSRVYGMCQGHNGSTYYDMPFCYDFSTAAFVAVTGFDTSNCPLDTGYPNGGGSGASAATWISPQMVQVGSKIIITHQGFTAPNYIGWIDIATLAWSAGNLSGAISFTVPPVAVTQFNGRAYYAVGGTVTSNNVVFSDSLDPTTCTNATQVLTVGDNQMVLGFGQQPYNSTSAGGIIQSILAFKANSIAQISGDSVTSNLLVNVIATGIGSKAPQTICSTPMGCMFMAQDGIRYVDAYGKIQAPAPSVRNPFTNCNILSGQCYPSTACAAYNSGMYRISLYTTDIIGNIYRQEWVYDFEYGWHGPHLYGASPSQTGPAVIQPYAASFIMTTRSNLPSDTTTNGTKMVISNLIPGPLDQFVEEGSTLTWTELSCALADDQPMLAKNLIEGTIAYNPGNVSGDITVSALPTPVGAISGSSQPPSSSSTITFTPAGALWGTAVWGAFTWGGSALTNMAETTLQFDTPVAYKNLQWQVTGTAALNQRIGPISSRSEIPGHTNLDLVA